MNDKYTENSKNDLFPLTLPIPGCQRATGNWKSYRNKSKSYGKAIGSSGTGLQSRQVLMLQQYDATNGLPSVKDNERRRHRRFFQLSSAWTLPQQANWLERFCSDVALGARRGRSFPRREDFRDSNERKSWEEYDEILFPIDWRLFRSLLSKFLSQRCQDVVQARRTINASDDLKYRSRMWSLKTALAYIKVRLLGN